MSDKLPTIDDVRAAAEKAKAFDLRSKVCHRVWRYGLSHICALARVEQCDACLGAKRAVEDIADHVDDAMRSAKNNDIHSDMHWQVAAVNSAERAARISSYFASEPNPVSEFRDAVKEMCK